MTLEELKHSLSTKEFVAKQLPQLYYTFTHETFKVNHKLVCRWELIEENGKFYLKTDQPLGDDKTLLIDVQKEQPLELELSFKNTERRFVVLIEA